MKAFESYKIEDTKNTLNQEKEQEEKKESLGRVYDIYAVRIFRFIYLKTGSKETAEDLTSETFLKMWKYIKDKDEKDFKEKEDFLKNDKIGSFIYKVARNLVVDFYRKKQFITTEIDQNVKNKVSDQKQDIFKMVSLKEDVEEIRKSLRQINDDYREIIILRHIEGLNTGEIAEITEKSEGSVRVLLHRAIKALGKAIKEREEEREEK